MGHTYEVNSFVPCGKIVGGESFSIVSDYLGIPTYAYDKEDKEVWHRELDIYGRCIKGNNDFVPFLYQGQYYDKETQLAYNRFRYYDPKIGMYISQDPIGIIGGMVLYGYVHDVNGWLDVFGLAGEGRGWLNWAKMWHDKRADEIFGVENKGRSIGGRNYDKYVDGKDIEFKSDNFSKGPRTKESLERMNKQLDKDIANKLSGKANPHWHFDHDPTEALDMKEFLKKMDDNGITRSHGKNYPHSH
ncbi:RHS repeat domain-containing protein [Myroides albus]|uniref:RHS repeat domain-containing protein n=1 Tax=Myroides albus TaxID=2562892 RepID=UPI00280C1F2C|nr:RHS repeat-associated core domain-containing protein [Myroides albus]